MIRHESMRGYFAYALYEQMQKNPNIWLITPDLGYKVFDEHFKAFPHRCINTGAAEQAASDICIGLALESKIPFFYSITPFAIIRCFETWRLYANHERIPVKIICSGRDKDYEEDGFSHWAEDIKYFMDGLTNIRQLWPETKEEVPQMVKDMINLNEPAFLSLKR